MKQLRQGWQEIARRELDDRLNACPNCGGEQRDPAAVVELPFTRENRAQIGSGGKEGFHVLAVTCRACQHVEFFSASNLDLLIPV